MKDNIIGDNIRRILKEKHITQIELAERLETTKQQISVYVNGRHVPHAPTLSKIAEALDVSVYDLTATDADREIIRLGRLVLTHPALKEIADMISNNELTNEQLSGLLEAMKLLSTK